MPAKALARAATLFVCLAGCALPLPAQVVTSGRLGWPDTAANPHLDTLSAGATVGIALPPAPHLLPLWNFADLSLDRLRGHNGASYATGLEVWISPAARPAQSHSPLLLAEAELGRRWGSGLHGFTTLGVGAGWSLGDWVPYVEYRRREGFHGGASDHQILVGVKFVLFG